MSADSASALVITPTQFLAVIETELENQGLKLAVQPDQSLLLTK